MKQLVLLSALCAYAFAQGNQAAAQFHAGERVEFSSNAACLGTTYAVSQNGTIKEVNTDYRMNYMIQADPLPNQAPRDIVIPLSHQQCGMKLIGGAAPQIAIDKLHVDQSSTVLADRAPLDCPNLNRAGKNGTPISSDMARKVITCLWEKPAQPGSDGAIRVDVANVAIGAPRAWIAYHDPQGSADSVVYPIHAKYSTKTFYRTRNAELTGQENDFACLVDGFGAWRCGIVAGPNSSAGTQREIKVQP